MAIPCGLAARALFDDYFFLFRCENNFDCDLTEENRIFINNSDISNSTNDIAPYKNIDV